VTPRRELTKYNVGALRPVTAEEITAALRLVARRTAALGDGLLMRDALGLPEPGGGEDR
jgi:hypothetical protein